MLRLDDEAKAEVFAFFQFYSRFEFALKQGGLATVGNKNRAKPDWEAFTNRIRPLWAALDTPEFNKARCHMLERPPRQQTAERQAGGTCVLGWKDTVRGPGEDECAYAFRCVHAVRNNLFHGGKFPEGPVSGSERDIELIRHAHAILLAVLPLIETVCRAFHEV